MYGAYRPGGFGGRPGFGRPGFGRPYRPGFGYGFGVPFLSGLLVGTAITPRYGYGYGYPYYPAPYYPYY